ncbi:hypothetical protein Tco_0820750 [Tanacetum coccineum]|uniref:Uncharacterized protein n=1 Tax=Tanacetum coccineum TaxID=301880 RepID=A0ABQ5AEI0_9ASTR
MLGDWEALVLPWRANPSPGCVGNEFVKGMGIEDKDSIDCTLVVKIIALVDFHNPTDSEVTQRDKVADKLSSSSKELSEIPNAIAYSSSLLSEEDPSSSLKTCLAIRARDLYIISCSCTSKPS